MAYEPIVLGSNLIPGIAPNIGALGNVYSNKDPVKRDPTVENEDGTFTIPTYERTVVDDIPDDFDWSMYGRAGPTLRYFHRVRTGEIQYDPDNDVVDTSTLGEGEGGNPNLPNAAEVLKQELINVGTQIVAGAGAQIGRAYAKTDDLGDAVGEFFDVDNPLELFKNREGATAKVKFSPNTANQNYNDFKANNPKATSSQLKEVRSNINKGLDVKGNEISEGPAGQPIEGKPMSPVGSVGGIDGYLSGVGDRSGFVTDGNKMSAAGRANVFGSLGAGGATVAANLIAGRNLKDSVKSGVKVGAGSYIGGLLFPGVGNFIGGLVGGRVICNELMRQGVMTRKQVVLDYKFTRDHLTPTHVNGYHVWAVWMVRQMRKGRFVPFWKHVAGHRANEIAYIYGERAKPDYLGKVYRKILEPICWSIGFFCKKTDWTVLYKQKEV